MWQIVKNILKIKPKVFEHSFDEKTYFLVLNYSKELESLYKFVDDDTFNFNIQTNFYAIVEKKCNLLYNYSELAYQHQFDKYKKKHKTFNTGNAFLSTLNGKINSGKYIEDTDFLYDFQNAKEIVYFVRYFLSYSYTKGLNNYRLKIMYQFLQSIRPKLNNHKIRLGKILKLKLIRKNYNPFKIIKYKVDLVNDSFGGVYLIYNHSNNKF